MLRLLQAMLSDGGRNFKDEAYTVTAHTVIMISSIRPDEKLRLGINIDLRICIW